MILKGFVFHIGSELNLLLFRDGKFINRLISDYEHFYPNLDDKADIVEVIDNGDVVALKSVHSISFSTISGHCTAEEAISFALINNPSSLFKCFA